MSLRLFDREWEQEEGRLTCGEATLDLETLLGKATPFSTPRSLATAKGMRALEIEVRAHQDEEQDLLFWFPQRPQGYVVTFGPGATVISTKNDPYGLSLVFQASGIGLKNALLDLAQRL